MLTVVLREIAEEQLELVPAIVRRRLLAALRVLAHVPRSGRPYPDVPDTFSRAVVIRRNWSYRIVYSVHGSVLTVEFFEPGWMPRDLL